MNSCQLDEDSRREQSMNEDVIDSSHMIIAKLNKVIQCEDNSTLDESKCVTQLARKR